MIIVLEGIELKPCPFCSAGAEIKSSTWEKDKPHAYDDKYWAKCTNDDCRVSPSYSTSPQAAAEKWNNRNS